MKLDSFLMIELMNDGYKYEYKLKVKINTNKNL